MSGLFSGLFLTSWPVKSGEGDIGTPNSPFQTTTGGYPHVTLFYAPEDANVDENSLFVCGVDCCKKMIKNTYTIEEAYINSFEKNGNTRYDVLMKVDAKCTELIEFFREHHLQIYFEDDQIDKFFMNTPHITHAITWDKSEANRICRKLNKKLPADFRITGFTID